MTLKLIPENVREITVTVGAQLAKFNCICLSFDLCMTQTTDDPPPLQNHVMCACKYEHVHLGIPYSKVVAYGTNLSIPVLKLMDDFTI